MTWHDLVVSDVYAALLSAAFLAMVWAGAKLDSVVLVCGTVLIVQMMIAMSPAPSDGRGGLVPGPRRIPVLVASLIATGLAVYPALTVRPLGESAFRIIETGTMAGALPAMAAAVLVAVVDQVRRTDGRTRLIESLTTAVFAAVIAVFAAGWVSASLATSGADVIVTVGVAGLTASVVWLLSGGGVDRVVLGVSAVLAATVVAVGATYLAGTLTLAFALTMGPIAAVVAIVGHEVGQGWCHGRPHRVEHWGFRSAVVIGLLGMVAHVGGQLVTLS